MFQNIYSDFYIIFGASKIFVATQMILDFYEIIFELEIIFLKPRNKK